MTICGRRTALGLACLLGLSTVDCSEDDEPAATVDASLADAPDADAAGPGGDAARDTGPGVERDADASSSPDAPDDASDDAESDAGRDADEPDADEPDADPSAPCDMETRSGVAMIEAESLKLTGDWSVRTNRMGYSGSGFIGWSNARRNDDPKVDQIKLAVRVTLAGRYRFDWLNRIGMGTNGTEHNDTWFAAPSAADAYGARIRKSEETRRYPKPACDDAARMARARMKPGVTEAKCANGSSRDGFMKVYSSGATDWKWSTRTSDNDAHDIYVEFDKPGVYEIVLSPRSTEHLIDRIVLHLESVPSDQARAMAGETLCSNRP